MSECLIKSVSVPASLITRWPISQLFLAMRKTPFILVANSSIFLVKNADYRHCHNVFSVITAGLWNATEVCETYQGLCPLITWYAIFIIRQCPLGE